MALSNWDTLAVDLNGPSRGSFVREEVEVQFYKNWLYLRDSKAWHAGTGWSEPTVCQILEGYLRYKKFDIRAKRGPQEGVFAIVRHGYGENLEVMVGCGVSGYGPVEWPCGHQDSAGWLCGPEYDPPVCSECEGPAPDPEFVGVSEESRAFLGKMVVEEFEHEPETLKKLLTAISQGVRFNQGDAFFADHLGTQVPGTEVGQATQTILSSITRSENDLRHDRETNADADRQRSRGGDAGTGSDDGGDAPVKRLASGPQH